MNHRWIFVLFPLIPVSVCYEVFWYLSTKWSLWRNSAPAQHAKRVAFVQEQVRRWNENGQKGFLCTARPGWLTMSLNVGQYKTSADFTRIQINLRDVLEVDPVRRVVRVEPLCTMGQLSSALKAAGWCLPVVPELDDLTVGGMICGVGIESSSGNHGLFNETCESYEIVMADGSLVRASKTQNTDLFYGFPWSHGTLGFLVSAEIRIIPAKQWARLSYIPCQTRAEGCKVFTEASRNPEFDFVEALAYNEDQMVVMTGNMTDNVESGANVNRIGLWFKPWFYKHVETYLAGGQDSTSYNAKKNVEYLPLRDYYHRHTRSIFWELNDIISFGNHPVFRFLLGWAMPPKISLLKATTMGPMLEMYDKHHVAQDMLVPISTLEESLQVFHEELQVYPLWMCPFKVSPPHDPTARPFCATPVGDNMMVDIGAYGIPHSPKYDAVPSMRRVEAFVRKVKGFQMLYADVYMTREEFREMFDHSMYDELRIKYNCTKAFPEVYDKISRAARRRS